MSFFVKLIPIHLFIDKLIAPKGEEIGEENIEISKVENKEENLSNGGKDKILEKEENYDSERNLKDIVYKKEE